jgi:hypothetical protein
MGRPPTPMTADSTPDAIPKVECSSISWGDGGGTPASSRNDRRRSTLPAGLGSSLGSGGGCPRSPSPCSCCCSCLCRLCLCWRQYCPTKREATQNPVRAARGVTKRNDGGIGAHGHMADSRDT